MDTLVLPGHASRLAAQLGALNTLRDGGALLCTKHVITASGGSIAFLGHLASWTADRLITVYEAWAPAFDPRAIPTAWGVVSADSQVRLSTLFEDAICESCMLSRGFTFTDLFRLYPVRFSVVASDIATMRPTTFDHVSHPNRSVIDAISASIAIPLFFRPVKWHGCLYVDGMISFWSAVRKFGPTDAMGVIAVEDAPTVAPRDSMPLHHAESAEEMQCHNLIQYVRNVMNTVLRDLKTSYQVGFHPKHTTRIIVPPLSFKAYVTPTAAQLRAMYAAGVSAVKTGSPSVARPSTA